MPSCRLSPGQVADAPELLVLAALDTNLWTLQVALNASFPELLDEWDRRTDGPAWRAARGLSHAAESLNRAIDRYRNILQAERSPPPSNDDLPF
jgi:hypothetical protein